MRHLLGILSLIVLVTTSSSQLRSQQVIASPFGHYSCYDRADGMPVSAHCAIRPAGAFHEASINDLAFETSVVRLASGSLVPKKPDSHSTLRYVVIGALVGGVLGAVWIGKEASYGYPKTITLSPSTARKLGAVVGLVVGAGVGALVRVATREKSAPEPTQ